MALSSPHVLLPYCDLRFVLGTTPTLTLNFPDEMLTPSQTDGLADNLPPTHIPALSNAVLSLLSEEENTHLSRAERGSEHARLLADVLVAASRRAMLRTGQEKDWRTPFDIESAKYGPKAHLRGGKIDDICVIAAVAGEAGLEIP